MTRKGGLSRSTVLSSPEYSEPSRVSEFVADSSRNLLGPAGRGPGAFPQCPHLGATARWGPGPLGFPARAGAGTIPNAAWRGRCCSVHGACWVSQPPPLPWAGSVGLPGSAWCRGPGGKLFLAPQPCCAPRLTLSSRRAWAVVPSTVCMRKQGEGGMCSVMDCSPQPALPVPLTSRSGLSLVTHQAS